MTDVPRAAAEPQTPLPQEEPPPGTAAREPSPATPAEDLAEALEAAFGPGPAVTSLHTPAPLPDGAGPDRPGEQNPDAAAPAPPAAGGPAAPADAAPRRAGGAGAAAVGHVATAAGGATAAEPPPATAPATPAARARRSRAGGVRRGPADPVRGLMYRHRELCDHAVDPLEIAAGLEAHGVTDRTALRYRHRDVFSLAEEMYVRTRRPDAGPPRPPAGPHPRTALAPVAHLLPLVGGLLVLVAAGLHGRAQAAVTGVGVAGVVLALVLGLQRGPLRVGAGLPPGAGLAVGWLLAYAAYGDWFLGELLGGATGVTRAPVVPRATAAALAGLTAAVLPAAAVARWFAGRARGCLRDSRDLAEFRARVRPPLAAAVAAVLGALVALQLAAVGAAPVVGHLVEQLAGRPHAPAAHAPGVPGTVAAAGALGALLFLARLLAVHGFPRAAAYGVAAACATQVTALLLVLAARVPGLAVLGRPVELLVADAAGFDLATVPAVACGAAALALLAYAGGALTRASAHRIIARSTPK